MLTAAEFEILLDVVQDAIEQTAETVDELRFDGDEEEADCSAEYVSELGVIQEKLLAMAKLILRAESGLPQ